jgi:hypothetical protein
MIYGSNTGEYPCFSFAKRDGLNALDYSRMVVVGKFRMTIRSDCGKWAKTLIIDGENISCDISGQAISGGQDSPAPDIREKKRLTVLIRLLPAC